MHKRLTPNTQKFQKQRGWHYAISRPNYVSQIGRVYKLAYIVGSVGQTRQTNELNQTQTHQAKNEFKLKLNSTTLK